MASLQWVYRVANIESARKKDQALSHISMHGFYSNQEARYIRIL